MLVRAAIEHQKMREWSQAKALWEAAGPDGSHILRDLNMAICCTWLTEGARALALVDRYLPWTAALGEISEASPESLRRLGRALLAVDLYASDLEGEGERIARSAHALAELGGALHELTRTPVAVVLDGHEIDVLEDVVNVGDLLIPLTLNSGRLGDTPTEGARRLPELYRKLTRDDLEPLTTRRERLATAIGLAVFKDAPHIFIYARRVANKLGGCAHYWLGIRCGEARAEVFGPRRADRADVARFPRATRGTRFVSSRPRSGGPSARRIRLLTRASTS